MRWLKLKGRRKEPKGGSGQTYVSASLSSITSIWTRRRPPQDYTVEGFPTLDLAIEYARRVTRDSLEQHRKPDQTRGDLRQAWYGFGESGSVIGSDYHGRDELDFFIDHPAIPEERDWQAIRKP